MMITTFDELVKKLKAAESKTIIKRVDVVYTPEYREIRPSNILRAEEIPPAAKIVHHSIHDQPFHFRYDAYANIWFDSVPLFPLDAEELHLEKVRRLHRHIQETYENIMIDVNNPERRLVIYHIVARYSIINREPFSEPKPSTLW